MRTFAYNIEVDDNLQEILQKQGLLLESEIAKSECILYKSGIDDLFKNIDEFQNIKKIISIEKIKKNAEFSTPVNIDKLDGCVVHFLDESVSEVSDKIKAEVSNFIDEGSFSDLGRYLSLVGIELVQNALIFKKNNKRTEQIKLELIKGENNYQICVEDPFGELDMNIFFNKIKRAVIEKTPEYKKDGAGLGFSMILQAVDELIVKVEKGHKTKICCMVNKYRRLKDYKSKSPSVYVL